MILLKRNHDSGYAEKGGGIRREDSGLRVGGSSSESAEVSFLSFHGYNLKNSNIFNLNNYYYR
jgi:hypothetical protein